jgi:cytochrome c oxidase accessory protein FixG
MTDNGRAKDPAQSPSSSQITLSLWTGFTFVGFFTPILDLGHAAATLSFSGWEGFWIVFYGFATYGNAGYMREQVCKYMCPYARFQSAMFDRDTLVISYDVTRGEPRGARKRSADPKALGLGDCIECGACVQVCPTGIDIRDGLQIECIACAACVDACDSVMDKMEYPRGLIRYTTESLLAGLGRRVLRPRTAIYATILGALLVAFTWGVTHRASLIVDVLHERNALYREMADGGIENGYTIKLVNKTDQAQQLQIALDGDETVLRIVGKTRVTVEPDRATFRHVARRSRRHQGKVQRRVAGTERRRFDSRAAQERVLRTEENE